MEKPPEVPDLGPDDEAVVETIHEATNDIDFGPAFMNDLLLFFRENARDLFSGQTTFFILGSYEDYPMRRLQVAERELNSRQLTYAFILCDLLDPKELNAYWEHTETGSGSSDVESGETTEEGPMSHCQFYLLANYSDYLVPVFEGRHAGPSVELGEIRNNFFDDSHAFIREYAPLDGTDEGSSPGAPVDEPELASGDRIGSSVDLTNPYSRPQEDLFALFDSEDRLYRWTYRADLAEEIQKMPRD